MTNLKISQLSDAGAFTGPELVPIVQSGGNYKATPIQLSTYVRQYNSVVLLGLNASSPDVGNQEAYTISIGWHSYSADNAISIGGYAKSNNAGIAIGPQSEAYGVFGVALGVGAFATQSQSIAIGKDAYSSGNSSLSVLGNTAGDFGIGIGLGTDVRAMHSIAIGGEAYTGGGSKASIAIGHYSRVVEKYGVAIGYKAKSNGLNAIAIGREAYSASGGNDSIVMGYLAYAQTRGIAMGKNSLTNEVYGIAIGYHTRAQGLGAVAIGGYASGTQDTTVAIGYSSMASDTNGIAIGRQARSITPSAIAIGEATESYGSYSIAIGKATEAFGNYSVAIGSDVIAEATNSIAIGNTSFANNPHSIVFGADVQDFTAASFVVRGIQATNVTQNSPTTHDQKFMGLTTESGPTVVLTADGGSPIVTNVPALGTETIARLTGSVIGYDPTLVTDSGGTDMATFVLAPVVVYANTDGEYTIIGTPTFTIETHTAGAADWAVPTLTIIDNDLSVTVTAQSVALNWLGFLKFETND